MSVDADLIKQIIEQHDRQRPRSLQTAMGPSEIGSPCARRLGYSTSRTPIINRRGLSLPAWIGTAAHEQMSQALANDPAWLSEVPVDIPETEHLTDDGEPIRGTLDAYHKPSRTVVDWKFLADSTIRKATALGTVAEQYRTQVQIYAYGLAAAGYPVETVAVAFIPRSGNPRLVHIWSEDYQPTVATDALARLEQIRTVARGGYVTTLPTAEQFCQSCPWYLPASTELHVACPGHVTPESPPLLVTVEDNKPPATEADGINTTTERKQP